MMRSRVELWGPYLAGAAVAVSFLLLLLAGLYTFRQQERVNRQLCQQTVDNRNATRKTWEAAGGLVLRTQQTEEGRIATSRFFDEILRSIPALTCRGNKPVEVLG